MGRRGLRHVDRLVTMILSLVFAVITLVSFSNVVGRYILDRPLFWAEEIARYGFVWLVFLGGAVGVAEGAHLGVDVVVKRFTPRYRRIIDVVIRVAMTVFAVSVAIFGVEMVIANQTQDSPAIGLNMGYVYLAIPVGMGLLAINLWRRRSHEERP